MALVDWFMPCPKYVMNVIQNQIQMNSNKHVEAAVISLLFLKYYEFSRGYNQSVRKGVLWYLAWFDHFRK